jgi:hypothetical protein
MVVWEWIRYARDRALEAEEVELQRLAEAKTVGLQRAAGLKWSTLRSGRMAPTWAAPETMRVVR